MDFDSTRVMHQVQYLGFLLYYSILTTLGLLENTRIRRAGYAYRELYSKFFYRFLHF